MLLVVQFMVTKSINLIISRFFIQTGAAIIPRTNNLIHLKENSEVYEMGFELQHADMRDLGWDSNEMTALKFKKDGNKNVIFNHIHTQAHAAVSDPQPSQTATEPHYKAVRNAYIHQLLDDALSAGKLSGRP